jgi:DNA adenine methylase
MRRVMSPLRYPGGKVRITEMVAVLLERNLLVGSHLYEPFAGGSAVSLSLLANGFVRTATWVERDPMIYAFWKMVKDRPETLIDRMMSGKVTLAAWRRMLPLRGIDKPTKANLADLGYAGLFFNRTCFSGIVGAGPIGGMRQSSSYKIDCRFNKKELAAAIRECSGILKKVDVRFGDGIAFLQKECLAMPAHAVVYVDPPYVTNGYKLYRYHFGNADHERLADVVNDLRVPWLMSYDNHELIRNLYIGEQAKFVKTYQSLKGSKFVKEILLLSDDFLLPGNEVASLPRRDDRRGHAKFIDYEH